MQGSVGSHCNPAQRSTFNARCQWRCLHSVRAPPRRGRECIFVCEAHRNSGSNLITQEVILFVFQQDLESTLVRALNTDNQYLAQDVREKLQSIDTIVQDIQALKGAGGDIEHVSGKDDIADSFRLRSKLQEAVVNERFEEAASLRDELQVLQEKLDLVRGKADMASQKLKLERKLRLGQRVIHKDEGYRGIICGWDASCSESEEWQEQAGISDLTSGADQPFYQLLVDVRDAGRVGDRNAGLIAYVAQESLRAPEVDDNWVDEYGGDGFSNPFKFKMFLGRDEKGDFLPARALREKYSQERRDVFPEDDEESEDEEENAQPNIRKGEQGGFNNDADMLNRLFGRSDENTPEDGRP